MSRTKAEAMFDHWVKLPLEIAVFASAIALVGIGSLVHKVWKRKFDENLLG